MPNHTPDHAPGTPVRGLARLFIRKSVAQMQAEHKSSELKRSLTSLNLVSLGIGCIIGTGIFVLTGRAAVDPEAARTLEDMYGDIVVVRGTEARVPRELLPLTAPSARPAPPDKDARGLIDPFKRGPEITEVH